ncbi:unnamed protein product [Pleuronectes platessa]|uniref:B-block binding subunit of TFIIIC domain-containing protein n=1 Tax=Pleuronectes platessa TaxID=8262 RepID=A0A9N7YFX0_PLEPL|nr:unnamed protein product [Pleuronectes platessa]
MDPWSAVADEVALEGLDGITVPTLWIRLEDRQPKFPLKLDGCTKELIWRFLVSNTDLSSTSSRRRDTTWSCLTGLKTSTRRQELEKRRFFRRKTKRERSDITKHVRHEALTPLVSLEEALERYGRKLVVVASQSVRFRSLIGSENDPDVKLNDDSYCLLEKVGRARWQGELQSELHRCSFKTDARKLHYMRKSLIKNGFITMQSHVTRAKSGQQQQHSILLLLKRFHVNRRTKYDILMEQVSDLLEQLPGQFSTMMAIKQQLDVADCTFKRVFHYMRAAKLVELCQFPLEELDPTAKHCTTKKGTKVLVRCLKLLKPYSQKGVPDDDDDDDEDEEDDSGTRRRGYPACGRLMEKDVLSQAYHIVLSSGTKGIPQDWYRAQTARW